MIWYEEEVVRLATERNKLPYEPKTIFYGSSSIRLWTTLYQDFEVCKPVNLGFGGSTLAACDWFFDRILQSYEPEQMVFYAGDNDLGDGRHPEEVFLFFELLLAKLKNRFPNIQFYFISIKPSIDRWDIVERIKYANELIRGAINAAGNGFNYIDIFAAMLDANGKPQPLFFEEDGLHLSERGYTIWKDIVWKHLGERFTIR